MKKILIATLSGIALLVSVCEAQNAPVREEAAKKQFVQPPPPPPPPPAPPVPPVPPVAELEKATEVAAVREVPLVHSLEIVNSGVNEKGYSIMVRTVNNTSTVLVEKDGRVIKSVSLKEWKANKKMYESQYGELPPPPPPPPPPAPPKPRDRS